MAGPPGRPYVQSEPSGSRSRHPGIEKRSCSRRLALLHAPTSHSASALPATGGCLPASAKSWGRGSRCSWSMSGKPSWRSADDTPRSMPRKGPPRWSWSLHWEGRRLVAPKAVSLGAARARRSDAVQDLPGPIRRRHSADPTSPAGALYESAGRTSFSTDSEAIPSGHMSRWGSSRREFLFLCVFVCVCVCRSVARHPGARRRS